MQDLQTFIDERAEHLAVMHLTRRQDLGVERMAADYSLDMLVAILQDKRSTGRVFGVQVKGRDRALKTMQELSLSVSEKEINTAQESPFPVYVFLFTMSNDQGYYRCFRYPQTDSDKASGLVQQDQWHILNEDSLEQIINDVNAWYDAKKQLAA